MKNKILLTIFLFILIIMTACQNVDISKDKEKKYDLKCQEDLLAKYPPLSQDLLDEFNECDKLNELERDKCNFEIILTELKKENPNLRICALVKEEGDFMGCYFSFANSGTEQNPIFDYCVCGVIDDNVFPGQSLKAGCYMYIGKYFIDENVCNMITSTDHASMDFKGQCIHDDAIQTQDSSKCELIEVESWKSECDEYFGIN